MSQKLIAFTISCIVGLVIWFSILSSKTDVNKIRSEILTGRVICIYSHLNKNGEPIFECKSADEVSEILKFIKQWGYENEQRQEI